MLREVSFGVYMANGVTDVVPNQPFRIRMINTSLMECNLPKGMIVGHGLAHPKGIVAMVDFTPNDPPTAAKPDVEGLLWKEQVDLNHLLPRQREQMFEVLEGHRSMWDGRLGEVKATTHRIELKEGARPFRAHPYRAGPRAREAEAVEVQRMLKAGVIEPAHAEWASPVVLVPKPDGSMRFCIDYRRLNALTVKDSYPLPRMDEWIDSLGDAKIFSTLDCNSGYWQIPVHPDDQDKTTFTSHEKIVQVFADALRTD
jgi:Reverse transcriptase (RNA-dependent DNA polymerase)